MTTARRRLRRLSASSVTISDAVPEHVMPAAATPRNLARAISRSGSRASSLKSIQVSGNPAVGGTSCHIAAAKLSLLGLLGLGRRQDGDAGQDQRRADDLRTRQTLAQHRYGDEENRHDVEMGCGKCWSNRCVSQQRHPGDERAEVAGGGEIDPLFGGDPNEPL